VSGLAWIGLCLLVSPIIVVVAIVAASEDGHDPDDELGGGA
jgi:hypothetical protein